MMKDQMSLPCVIDWEKKLLEFYSDDLSIEEREEVQTHIQSCSACAAVLTDYQSMDTMIQNVLTINYSVSHLNVSKIEWNLENSDDEINQKPKQKLNVYEEYLEEIVTWSSVGHVAPTVPILTPAEKELPPRSPFVPPHARARRYNSSLKFVGILCFLVLTIVYCSALFTHMQENTISNASTPPATFSSPAAPAPSTFSSPDAMAPMQANPSPSYFPDGGHLALYDPLKDDSEGYQWLPTTSPTPASDGNCTFKKGGLDVSVNGDAKSSVLFHPCIAENTYFSDFAYEVHMTLLVGDCGGITFRGQVSAFYSFIICQDGSYGIARYLRDQRTNITPTLELNPILKINKNLNQDTYISVWAKGTDMMFFVNGQQIERMIDTSYVSGNIGVFASSQHLSSPTEAIFSNARVWTFP